LILDDTTMRRLGAPCSDFSSALFVAPVWSEILREATCQRSLI
jgi:hypothetical protein